MNSATNRTGAHFLIGHRAQARYLHSPQAMYQHNCYIEALPRPYEPEEAAEFMKREPSYHEGLRFLPALERLHAVMQVANCVIPLPEYIQLEQKFSRMLHNGYFARNPLSAEWVKQMHSAFSGLTWERGGYPITPLVRSTAAGFSIFGASGVGKSTLIESILSLYPQVIIHTEYDGRPFDQQQLVWLKLDCPFDGSPKGLCATFFQAIDHIMDKDYSAQYNKSFTTDYLMPVMARLAGELGLGVLVIDEIQRLKAASSGGAEKILTFLVQLTNTIGVPVVLLGTYKAFSLFTKDFATARRGAGQGDVIIHNFAHDDFWSYFITKIWRYQFTNVSTKLTDALSKALYEESQGIADIAVKIYMFAQWQVIGMDDERITPDVIKAVAKENLNAAGPILNALRNNDIEALSKIEDISPVQNELDVMLAKATRRISLSGKIATLRNEMMGYASNLAAGELPQEQIALLLIHAGFCTSLATKCASEACTRFATEMDLKLATIEAFRLAKEAEDLEGETAKEKDSLNKLRKTKEHVFPQNGDLRDIVKNAGKNVSPYEALKNAGVIKPATEYFR